MYRDFTGDLEAEQRLDEVTALTPALTALGFTKLGLAAVGSEGAVEQVWSSREKDAFAEPAWLPGKRPHLSFRTLFEDGTILETTTPREGPVRFVPFWTRQHQPRSGYFYEEHQGMPHELWLRHKARIDAHRTASSSAIPSHDSLTLFIALAERAVRIARIRTRLSQVLGLVALIAVAVPVTLRKDLFPSWTLPLTAIVWGGATWGVFRLMLSGSIPKVRPAADLLRLTAKK